MTPVGVTWFCICGACQNSDPMPSKSLTFPAILDDSTITTLNKITAGSSLETFNTILKVMNNSNTQSQRIAKMTFSSVYPMYVAKVEKKGRTKEELHKVIEWLTGFGYKKLQELIKENVTFETFFRHASLNPNAHRITGVICGYRVEEIEDPLTQQVRYLDKLVDELAKGRKMEKILRSP